MPARGLLIDLDGTLVDTNALHVHAFDAAFRAVGFSLPPGRIAAQIGKGGDTLVPALLGPQADSAHGNEVRDRYKHEFARLARENPPRLFPQAIEFLQAARGLGLRTALATSSMRFQLDLLARILGTDLREHVDAFTTTDDAQSSKPAPDLWTAAAKKLALHPAQCVAVGDTVYDQASARRAGITSIGLTTWPAAGTAATLRSAGARCTCNDIAHLLRHLPAALQSCAPLAIDLTPQRMSELMAPAIEQARRNLQTGGVPIAAAIYDTGGKLLSVSANRSHITANPIDHAEIVAFNAATGQLPLQSQPPSLLLACTLEPCVMCTGAAMQSGVDTILFAQRAPADEGSTRVTPPQSPASAIPRVVHAPQPVIRDLFNEFLDRHAKAKPDDPQVRFVRQLLEIS